MIRWLDAQRCGIFVHEGDEVLAQLGDALLVLERPLDDLVIDVGDVADIGHAQPTGAQPALHDVKDDQDAGMAQMAVVVNGHAADVHASFAGVYRHEVLFFPRQ
jgi:hypothetical protein